MCEVLATSSDGPSLSQCCKHGEQTFPVRGGEAPAKTHGIRHPLLAGRDRSIQLQRGQPLHQSFSKRRADRHYLADRFHRGAELRSRLRELLEGPARDLHNRVVQGRLEGCVGLSRDVVGDLVQGVVHGQQRCDLGDRKARRLGGQRRAPGDPGVHLDDHPLAGLRIDGELDVRPTRGDTHPPNDREGVVAHCLVLAVRERLLRRHGDGISSVDPHRVHVLDRADDDRIVDPVPNHLQLELLPTQHRLLEQHPPRRAGIQGRRHHVVQLVAVVDRATTLPTEGEARPNDQREADPRSDLAGLCFAAGEAARGHLEPHLLHGLLEQLPVLA